MLTQAITPAVKSHMDVQLSLATDLYRKMFDTAQKISGLNLHLAQDMLEHMHSTSHQLMAAKDAAEMTSILSSQLHPCADKLRTYQQQFSSLLADANADLSKAAETHIPEASRTAAAVADELVRAASEETEKAAQRQREVIEKMHESARRGVDGLLQSQNRDNSPSQQTH
ncbi:phasin family protein [Oxalobacteraceae bacterium GrIS 1.11]